MALISAARPEDPCVEEQTLAREGGNSHSSSATNVGFDNKQAIQVRGPPLVPNLCNRGTENEILGAFPFQRAATHEMLTLIYTERKRQWS